MMRGIDWRRLMSIGRISLTSGIIIILKMLFMDCNQILLFLRERKRKNDLVLLLYSINLYK
jgi:hypothetical protein